MTEERWEELEDLVCKINAGKYKCGMAAQGALLDAYNELKQRREAGYGAERAVAERIRQKSVEGWTPEHDAQHTTGDLVLAAVSYAMNKFKKGDYHQKLSDKLFPPWNECRDKREKHDRERSLEIAAALIMAELDRIQAAKEGE